MLAAADGVIVTADSPVPTLPIATAMAMGLPIVSTLTPTISELLEDRRNALLTGENRSRVLAKRFLDLKDDPQLENIVARDLERERHVMLHGRTDLRRRNGFIV